MGVSPTQRRLEPTDVARLVRASFGPDQPVLGCQPLTGGGYAAVWSVQLRDDRTVVLKVAPPAGVPLLRYERGLLAAEARYYRLVARYAPQVPVPRMVRYGRDPSVLDGDWMFMTRLAGQPLSELDAARADLDTGPVRRDLGAAIAAVHAVTGRRYGYDGRRVAGSSWRAAYTGMVDELFADASTWGVDLPATADRIRSLVDRHGDLLDRVDRPALLHFDLWDGNVLAAPGGDGTLRLTGLVDGERFLYGDPLVDLVTTAMRGRIEDDPSHPFRLGYAQVSGTPLVLDGYARRRLVLYRLHLFLLMTVEMPSRAITREAQPGRYEWLASQLDEQLVELGRGLRA